MTFGINGLTSKTIKTMKEKTFLEEVNDNDYISHRILEEELAEDNLEKWSILQTNTLKNAMCFMAQIGWQIARNEVWASDKGIDPKKVEKFLRTEEGFEGMPEEAILYASHIIQHIID